jgi:hypothetical protein
MKKIFLPILAAILFSCSNDNGNCDAEKQTITEWNVWTGAYEFQEEEENIDQLEEDLSMSITYDINGYFELQN